MIRDWKSRWYAEGGEYADLLHKDLGIRQYIGDDFRHAGISRIEIERFPNKVWIYKGEVLPTLEAGEEPFVV